MSPSTEGRERGRLRRGWDNLPWDYGIDGWVWPAIFSFLVILLGLLVVTFPARLRIEEVATGAAGGGGLFTSVYLFVFGIAAITLGQAEAHWHERLSWRGSLLHLGVRVALVVLLSLPFWLVFFSILALDPARLPLVLGQLWLFGAVFALFGWGLALSGASDLIQFNVKYLVYAGFLFGSLLLPGLRALNPFLALEFALWGVAPAGWSFAVAELGWLGLGVLLAAVARRYGREFSFQWEESWKQST